MQTKVRVGVIGVGYLGKHHARIYSELDNVDLVGVVDVSEKLAKKAAHKCKTQSFTNYKDIIDKVDAVSIVTPTETHFELASEFLRNGISVLVEKPITNNPEDAAKLIEISEQSGKILQVGHVERFNAAVRKVREYVTDPRFIEVNRLGRFPERSLDIGVVLDLMIHDIDIILSFVNSTVSDIRSMGASVLTSKEDIANCRIEFDNGCVANITASRISYKNERKFRVFQHDSYISLDYTKQDFIIYKKKKEVISSPSDVERIAPTIEKTEPLKEELISFIHAVSNDAVPSVTGSQGLEALKLALKITEQI